MKTWYELSGGNFQISNRYNDVYFLSNNNKEQWIPIENIVNTQNGTLFYQCFGDVIISSFWFFMFSNYSLHIKTTPKFCCAICHWVSCFSFLIMLFFAILFVMSKYNKPIFTREIDEVSYTYFDKNWLYCSTINCGMGKFS